MIFDVILIAILALTMVFGFRSGIVYTFIHTIGWALSIVLAFVWSPKLQDFLIEKTSLKNSIYEAFLAKFSQSLAFRDESIENLPAIFKKIIENAHSSMTASLAETMSDILFVTLCFVIVVLTVKILLWLITELFSKKKTDGITGFTDGILGLAAGLIHGVFIVFFFFAFLTVINGFLSPELSTKIAEALSASAFAKDFYDNNLLLLVVRSFLK